MNSSKLFSADEANTASLWEMPSIAHAESGERLKVNGESTKALTVEEVEAIQKQAYDEAAEAGRKEGYQEGLKQGRHDGLEKGLQEGQNIISKKAVQFDKLLKSLDKPLKELDGQIEQELVALSISMAKHLVRRELKTDPGQVIAVVREAMYALPLSSRNIRLYLHPGDAELVRSAFSLDDGAANWEVIEEPLLTRGGCRIDTDTSRIDASVEKRLAAVIATIMGGEREGDNSVR